MFAFFYKKLIIFTNNQIIVVYESINSMNNTSQSSGLNARFKNININCENKNKTELYTICKQFNDCMSGLSKMTKEELYDVALKLSLYKSQLVNYNYKKFKINNKTITLDDEQYSLVMSKPNIHIRVIAGAGSGKTTTICMRIKYLIDNFISPNKILVMTFNVDARKNIEERMHKLFGFNINVQIRTIDSFCCFLRMKYLYFLDNILLIFQFYFFFLKKFLYKGNKNYISSNINLILI